MMPGDIRRFDGKPLYCTVCGDVYDPAPCGQGCVLESEAAAKARAERGQRNVERTGMPTPTEASDD
jgi:hypothetical protein